MVNVRRGHKVVSVVRSDSDESDSDGGYGRAAPPGQFIGRAYGGGKMLRAMPPAAHSSDDGSASDSPGPAPSSSGGPPGGFVSRGRGKQLMMRRGPPSDDGGSASDASAAADGSASEEDYSRPMPGRGKMLRSMYQPRGAAPEPDPSSSEDEAAAAPAPMMRRGGGKSLASMYRPPVYSDDDDDEEDEPPPPQVPQQHRGGGGKSLRNMYQPRSRVPDPAPPPSSSSEDEVVASTVVSRGGGKQLASMYKPRVREPEPPAAPPPAAESESEDEEEAPAPVITQPFRRGGGKQLSTMRHMKGGSDSDDDDDSDDDAKAKSDSDSDNKEHFVTPAPPSGSGKSLRNMYQPRTRPPVDVEEIDVDVAPKPVVVAPVTGGKRLVGKPAPSSPQKSDSDDSDDDSDEKMAQSSEDEKPAAPPAPAPAPTPTPAPVAAPDPDTSDDDDDDEEEADLSDIGHDQLIEDEEDRDRLNSMPELDREAILADRFEKKKSEREMAKVLREEKREQRKKAAGAASDGATPAEEAEALAARASGRNRDVSGVKTKKAEARASIREEKKKQVQEDESEEEVEDEDDLDFGSESDEDDDDDDSDYGEGGKPKPKKKKPSKSILYSKKEVEEPAEEAVDDISDHDVEVPAKDDNLATLEDFRKITLPRESLKKWCNEPYFERAVVDYFVRIGVGKHNVTGKHCYRLCKVVGVVEFKSDYAFPKTKHDSTAVVTNKLLTVQFGSAVKDYRMIYMSDNRPSEDEVAKYVSHVKSDRNRQSVLTRREASRLRRVQKKTVNNYVYTKEDIEKSIRSRKRKKGVFNIGMERTRMAIAVQAAKQTLNECLRKFEDVKAEDEDEDGHDKLLRQAEEDVEDARETLQKKQEEEKEVLNADSQRKRRTLQTGKIQAWERINKRAKNNNQQADFNNYKERAALKIAKAADAVEFDPFARREVKPKVLWDVGMDDAPAAPPAEAPVAAPPSAPDTKPAVDVLGAALAQKSAASSHHQF
eukprot:CAMPEP_0194348550 /NCGR_PEP_ID=MMETSP0171-20130528/106595_1 /TAXON_ID=218684 /ORGANISM="Corethron pennatum, Strain L29A3" /LENGTH=990 /DNA_ID=CAMNT_0039115901 /DNA_START=59 /DNA_END=3028 /DNA_ORIENTATION=+